MTARVVCTRNGFLESKHTVHVAVVDADGHTIASAGEPDLPIYYRSAVKPIQALPLVEDGVVEALGLTDAELALCCASHNAEPEHLTGVLAILEKAGLTQAALECGPTEPMSEAVAAQLMRAGESPAPIHNDCSGKHAGMLALAVHHGWPTVGYVAYEHPVQRRMHAEMARWSGMAEAEIGTGVDGCGVVCFRAPLTRLASSFARFAAAAARGEPAGRVVRAMTAHAFMVAGTDRLCTSAMEVGRGRIFTKMGAEGVYAAGDVEQGVGVAIKVEDGARRASRVALVGVLEALELLSVDELDALSGFAKPLLRNTLGAVVGGLRAEIELESH
ncbi:MAG: asparaginase [Gemmatimonadota bacterium]|nr:MAG: asparaginase [Gemmatimonadota bacterium]